MRKTVILIFCLILVSVCAKPQEANSKSNIDIELGLGYNTLSMEAASLNENVKQNRNQFTVFPSLKLKYSAELYQFENNSAFILAPFVGYNMFGGKSKTTSNGYKDIIQLQSFEIGLLPTFSMNDKISFYGGVKGQYIFSAKIKSYGTIVSPVEAERKWETNDFGELIKDISFNAGAGFNYKINRFSLGIETWFGVSNLSDVDDLKIHENNYRLIIGYRIK